MTAHVAEEVHGKVLEVHLTGKLNRSDYEKFCPQSEELIKQYGKIRILVELHDFRGWDAGALWEDLKWDSCHFNDIERLAVVGDSKWHKWMASFCKPFTAARIRYFTPDKSDEARAWASG
jgi:hypothetical protein